MARTDMKTFIKRLKEVSFETYDVRFASVMCLFLSATMWWIPMLGPAVAGYVCGRKSGSMVKGFASALLVGTALTASVLGLSYLILAPGGFPELPADAAASNLHGLAAAVASYLCIFFKSGTSSMALSQLGILALFGMVGGTLSRQVRKETALILSTGAVESAIRPMPRSVELYVRGKKLGFESFDDCMLSQNMNVNVNPDSKSSGGGERVDRRAPTTVQTVTTTASNTAAEKEKGPFADILDRSDRRKEGRGK